MKKITRRSLTKALEAAVAERGADFVYPDEWRNHGRVTGTCRNYIEGVGPACIFGNAFTRLGVDVTGSREWSAARYVLEDVCGVNDERLVTAAEVAQRAQDDGLSWGDVLDRFKTELVTR